MYLRLRRLLICFVVFVAVGAVFIIKSSTFWSGDRAAGVPFGVHVFEGTDQLVSQDFSMHLNFLREIWQQKVAHPYQLADQEEMIRHWYPRIATGMPHAYSPVLMVAAAPFLALPPDWASFGMTVLNALLLIALTAWYLLPRIKNSVQAGAVLGAFFSYVLLDVFLMGQTSIVTTCLLAGGVILLETRSKRTGRERLLADLLLGLILYLLAIKPSVGLILVALIIGERIWITLLACGVGLLLTWALLANHYGGLIAGLQDYLWILNHYCQADMTPFLRPGLAPGISTNFTSALTIFAPEHNATIFLASRLIFEGLIFALIVARWFKRISFSTQLQGLLWTFLLFCPHLLVTEDFVICLLIVEGNFFRAGWSALPKILLVFLLVNLILIGNLFTGPGSSPLPLAFIAKVILAGWWLVDLVRGSGRREIDATA